MIRRCTIIIALVISGLSRPGRGDQIAAPALSINALTPAGGIRPDVWTALPVVVTNPTDQAADSRVELEINPVDADVNHPGTEVQYRTAGGTRADTQIRFASDAWVSAHCSRLIWLPLRTPSLGNKVRAVSGEVSVGDSSGSSTGRRARTDIQIPAQLNALLTLVVADGDQAENAVTAMYLGGGYHIASNGQSARSAVVSIAPDELPAFYPGLEGVDNIVLGAGADRLDNSQVQMLREWVCAGGNLWIIWDQFREGALAEVLGNENAIVEVDRTRVATFAIEGSHSAFHVALDEPVTMVRVMAPTMETVESVNGWPAMLRTRIGAGHILITTLDLRGWKINLPVDPVAHKADRAKKGARVLPVRSVASISPLVAQAGWFYQASRNSQLLFAPVLQHLAESQVGYRIASRASVLGMLMLFCGGVLGGGFGLMRADKLEHLGAVGAVLAVGLTGVILAFGSAAHHAAPLTLASAQLAEVDPEARCISSFGAINIYNPIGSNGRIFSDGGGIFWPDLTGDSETSACMVWRDRDLWEWDNLRQPAGGLLRGEYSRQKDISDREGATIEYDSRGIHATVGGERYGTLEEVVLIGPNGMVLPRREANGFVADEQDLARPGQLISGAALSDVQRARQTAYRSFFANREARSAPALLGWTSQSDIGIQMDARASRRDEILVDLPMKLAPVIGMSRVTIPSAFIGLEPLIESGLTSGSIPYNTQTGTWLGKVSKGTQVIFRFTLPRQVLPIRLGELHLKMNINAPGREVKLLGVKNNKVVTLGIYEGPIGPEELEFKGDQCPQAREDGSLYFGFSVSSVEDVTRTWSIDDARVWVVGETSSTSVARAMSEHE